MAEGAEAIGKVHGFNYVQKGQNRNRLMMALYLSENLPGGIIRQRCYIRSIQLPQYPKTQKHIKMASPAGWPAMRSCIVRSVSTTDHMVSEPTRMVILLVVCRTPLSLLSRYCAVWATRPLPPPHRLPADFDPLCKADTRLSGCPMYMPTNTEDSLAYSRPIF